MEQDEQAIRAVVATWMEATAAGDVSRVLELMADDVVFLGPGRPPFGKAEYAANTRAMEARVEGAADIQEIRVFGEGAYCWNQLTVTIRPDAGGPPHQLSGPALSVFRKNSDGAWVIVRDANMVTPVQTSEAQTDVKLSQPVPIVRILDEAKAREFYVGFLGFSIDWEHRFDGNTPLYMQISRRGCIIHLSEHYGDATPGCALRIGTNDVESLNRELLQKNYKFAKPGIGDTPWQTREMSITDPFGNRLIFSQPL